MHGGVSWGWMDRAAHEPGQMLVVCTHSFRFNWIESNYSCSASSIFWFRTVSCHKNYMYSITSAVCFSRYLSGPKRITWTPRSTTIFTTRCVLCVLCPHSELHWSCPKIMILSHSRHEHRKKKMTNVSTMTRISCCVMQVFLILTFAPTNICITQ